MKAVPIFKHADGALYRRVGVVEIKMDDGRWEPGVLYRPINQVWPIYATTKKRWADRFTDTGDWTNG